MAEQVAEQVAEPIPIVWQIQMTLW